MPISKKVDFVFILMLDNKIQLSGNRKCLLNNTEQSLSRNYGEVT